MILIISSKGDQHAVEVMNCLEGMGSDYHLLDLSKFPKELSMSMRFGQKNESGFDYVDSGGTIDLSKVGAAWWRRPQPYELHDEIKQPHFAHFALREMEEAFSGLWQNTECFWLNPPHADIFASRKAHQLKLAGEIGLKIPDTLITNNVQKAKSFIDDRGFEKTAYKPFAGTEDTWRETRVLKKNELGLLEKVKYAPLIFQEYIPARADLRITVVGNQFFPAAIFSQNTSYPQDFRMDLAHAEIEAVELPSGVKSKLMEMMRQLGIYYGAFDMRLTPDGEYVFLEVNPAGQWLFVECKTGQPISKSIAIILSENDLYANAHHSNSVFLNPCT